MRNEVEGIRKGKTGSGLQRRGERTDGKRDNANHGINRILRAKKEILEKQKFKKGSEVVTWTRRKKQRKKRRKE